LEAAGNFRSASQELVNAATPVRANSEQIERSIRNLSESTDNIARSAHATVASARDALDAATAILGEKARAVEFSLTGLAALVEQFRGQGDRLDDMDEKLGNAFETYRDQVDRAVAGMQDHMKNLNRELAPALDTLRVVVDRAEQFMPQSRL
jgi:ABC-type transporter Mla subunit MlaD